MHQKKQKILMIEEDPFLRKIYRNKFLKSGFDFIEATNGVEGLSKAFSERPDLILLDIILPRKNGFDVLIDLKKNPDTRDIPIIILSNLSQEADIKRGLSLGARDYLVKTEASYTEVVNKVKECLLKTALEHGNR